MSTKSASVPATTPAAVPPRKSQTKSKNLKAKKQKPTVKVTTTTPTAISHGRIQEDNA